MKKKMVILEKEKLNLFYKKIRLLKLYRFFGRKICVLYKEKEYFGNEKDYPIELKEIFQILEILNLKTRKEKTTLAYDYACDYLDEQFINKNLCDFKNDMCKCNRQKPKEKQVNSCCVRASTGELCKHFDKKKKCCKTKNLACKLFVCPTLYKKKIRFSIRKIPYTKYFFSLRQKEVAITTFFLEREKVIEKLLTVYKF